MSENFIDEHQAEILSLTYDITVIKDKTSLKSPDSWKTMKSMMCTWQFP